MKPDDTFRRAEGSGPWLHEPRKPERPALRIKWLVIFAAAFAIAALIGTVAIPAPPPFEPGPGYDICTTKGC